MNILERLIKIANTLDQQGMFDESALLDEIIREAVGYREQLAPGMMGLEDPTRLPAGGGVGGLPRATGPGIKPGPTGPARPETEEERAKRVTQEGLARLKRIDQRQIRALVRRFTELNKVRTALGLQAKPLPPKKMLANWKGLGRATKQKFSPYDRDLIATMEQKYPGLMAKRPSAQQMLAAISRSPEGAAVAGGGAQRPGQPGATPSQLTPEQARRMPETQKAFTDRDVNVAATQIYRQMMQVDPNKAGQFSQEKIRQMIKERVDSGMDLQTAQQIVSGQVI